MLKRNALLIALALGIGVATLAAQTVTRESLPGVTNFAKLETTIACAGATTPAAVAGLKQMGYASIINLPFNTASPNPAVVDSFLKAVTEARNQPAFVHCASGNRAAALWMIKRM